MIIFNQGNTPDREGLIVGTLAPDSANIPVVGASFADGVALSQAGLEAHHPRRVGNRRQRHRRTAGQEHEQRRDGRSAPRLGSRGAWHQRQRIRLRGDPRDGADDGQGEAQNTVRFAWWGDEEGGLVGSTAYVDGLTQAERDRIALYMNYDMIGSPNFIQMVYDADQSTFEAPVEIPAGSTAIEDIYESYYTSIGEPYDDSAFDGRSDYQAFIENGIPSGGLFTGAEEIKTAEQQAIWGGTTGEQFDPCYHEPCDTFANNNDHALTINSDLVAFAQLTFAFSTQSVNGVAGKPVPGGSSVKLPAPAGPEGTFPDETP